MRHNITMTFETQDMKELAEREFKSCFPKHKVVQTYYDNGLVKVEAYVDSPLAPPLPMTTDTGVSDLKATRGGDNTDLSPSEVNLQEGFRCIGRFLSEENLVEGRTLLVQLASLFYSTSTSFNMEQTRHVRSKVERVLYLLNSASSA